MVWFCTAVCVCVMVSCSGADYGGGAVLCGVISFIVVGCGVLCIAMALVYECILILSFLRWFLVLGICV